jgi:hypothetical protein
MKKILLPLVALFLAACSGAPDALPVASARVVVGWALPQYPDGYSKPIADALDSWNAVARTVYLVLDPSAPNAIYGVPRSDLGGQLVVASGVGEGCSVRYATDEVRAPEQLQMLAMHGLGHLVANKDTHITEGLKVPLVMADPPSSPEITDADIEWCGSSCKR